ncbi:MAG TPA: serine/threonine-protein kinase, partial [Polyangia bacterium]
GTQICRGLAYAHSFVDKEGVQRPIIHRDVSPANVMIGRDGSVKLVDFGLAQQTRGETLAIDTFLGKLAYMSPEQLERRQLDRRADVFALGVTLWELVVGKRLFAGADDAATLQRLQTLVVERPSRLNPAASPTLDAIVLRALHKDPKQRYQSAAELLAALDGIGALAASRAQLVAHLGAVAPDVFTRVCDGCGARLPWSADCASCKTRAEPAAFADEREPVVLASLPAAATDAAALGARVHGWLRHRWLVVQLTLLVLWRQLDAWMAERRARAMP